THVISGTTPWTISDILHVQRQPPSLTHSTGRDKEKALQQKSLQSLIFTQSGRRDLNPRPPEPHSGALPGCATSRCHFPGNPHPVNSQQMQDAQTHSWCSARSG